MSTDKNRDFIREAIDVDLENGRYDRVITRFPPEPNAHLHIGHGKAICVNFGIAASYDGQCNLRYDDTNPTREEQEYVDSMQEDIRWLGFDWGPQPYYASDYFGQLYDWAVALIKKGLAYVDDQTADEIRENRGTLTEPGKNSPYRDRSIEENLDFFEQMKDGAFPDGSRVLRAKIDMAAPNINLRDPVMYRIMHTAHHRTGDAWCIYPMYDWAHGQSDAIEGVTHSLCSDEFTNNRPLYDWFIEKLGIFPSRQIEYARGNITYTVLSKRYILQLIEQNLVSGWDDPRLYTLRGLRRLGYPPEAIRRFWTEAGIAKRGNNIDIALLEYCIRDQLNQTAPRRMAVLNPLKVVIENYPEDQSEMLTAINNPEDDSAGTRLDPLFAPPLHRARGLYGRPAAQVLPPRPRPRSPPALRLFPHLHRGRQRRQRRDRRTALHVRSGHARRQRTRWPQGQGHPALGLSPPRGPSRGAALRPTLQSRKPARSPARGHLAGQPQPRRTQSPQPLLSRAVPRRHGPRGVLPV